MSSHRPPSSLVGTLAAAIAVTAAAAVPSAMVAPPTGDSTSPPAASYALPGVGDADRAARVVRLLASVDRGQALLAAAGAPLTIRFVSGESAVTHDGLLLLVDHHDDRRNAGRLGHLLLHLVGGPLRVRPGDGSCRRELARTLQAEAAAHALELELLRALGSPAADDAFPFARAFWRAAPRDRIAAVRAYLEAHPAGGAGVPGFAGTVRRQCDSPATP